MCSKQEVKQYWLHGGCTPKALKKRREPGQRWVQKLSTERLGAMGFALAAYPLTLLSTAAFAMRQALLDLQAGHTPEQMLSFEEMKTLVGFNSYLK